MERIQLHPSGLSLHTDCGEAWRRVYIEGERGEPNEYLVIGSALDAAVSAELKARLSKGSLAPVISGIMTEAEMIEIAADYVRRSTLEPVLKHESLDRAVNFARYAHRKLCPPINVKSIQRPWSIRMDAMLRRRGLRGMKIDYVGTLDVEEWLYDFTHLTEPAGVGVIDVKTSKRLPPKNAADAKYWIQMTSYVLGMFVLDRVAPKRVQIQTLVDSARGVVMKPSFGQRDNHDFAALFNRIEQFARSYKSGILDRKSVV